MFPNAIFGFNRLYGLMVGTGILSLLYFEVYEWKIE